MGGHWLNPLKMNAFLSKFSELQLRVMAALVGGVVILAALYWNEWSYFGVFFVICGLAMWEFYRLLGLDGNLPLKTFGTINGLFLYALTFLVEKYRLDTELYLLIFISLSGVYFIKLYVKKDDKPFRNIAYTFLGVFYVAVPFSLLNLAMFINHVYSHQVLLGALFILWASDTGAYFSGRAFGRHKLFMRVSPKKTWEGSIGGALLAVGTAYIISLYFNDLTTWKWLCSALIIVVAGTYGDLVESLFKRSIHIKDSGSAIPGHGGFLDRFDSLLLSAPFIVAFVRLV
jgi:phosphatidate cytidylyltransferase